MTTEGGPEPAEGTVGPGGKFQPVPQDEATTPEGEKSPKKVVAKKSVEEVSKEVVAGHWGRGRVRTKRLEDAGYDPAEVSAEVNKIVNQR